MGDRQRRALLVAVEDGFALLDPDWEHVEQVGKPIWVSCGIKLAFERSSAAREVPR